MLVENLQRIIKRGACETARRVAQIYKQIFEFAEAAGITPPNQIGNLSRTLPAKRVKHFAAVTDPKKLGAIQPEPGEGCSLLHAELRRERLGARPERPLLVQ